MSYLELKNITKKYEDLVALDDFSFSVEKNEFAVLFGSSAAGKTTTLRCIAGLEKVQDGQVWFNEKNFTNEPIQGREMAMVFQTFALYPHLTTEDNLAYPLVKKKIDKSEIKKKIAEISDMLRITHALKRKPDTLSGGEQQRLAIGRALIQQPKLLLLDEPLANLDAKLRHDTRAELKRLQRDLNMTMVYATPDQLEALTMGDNITIIKNGKLIQKGSPDKLYESPENVYVGKMIGSPEMNIMKAKINNQNIELPFGEISLANQIKIDQNFISTDLMFGIRPNDINVSSDGNNFNAKIFLKEPLGDVTIIDLIIGQTKLKMILPEEEAINYNTGQNINVSFNTNNSYLFSSETGVSAITN
ncbi:MAG: sugar ABC transporter ATP-binding protein [Candidatus Marinimicrobia bacterium]|nr:sugar ABC transporter ATP-binding protein [Candidatus Neomarinimicrobiota bacterium]